MTLPDAEFEAFHLLNYGNVPAPAIPSRFGFQLDLSALKNVQEVVFGLVQSSPVRQGRDGGFDPVAAFCVEPREGRVGFAVRVDLERGEIWDLVNGSGLIGWIEEPVGWNEGEPQETMLLSLEIERVGSALLPKLQIGGEEWLYPAIRSTDAIEFTALAGCDQTSQTAPIACFSNPTVWTEDLRAYA